MDWSNKESRLHNDLALSPEKVVLSSNNLHDDGRIWDGIDIPVEDLLDWEPHPVE